MALGHIFRQVFFTTDGWQTMVYFSSQGALRLELGLSSCSVQRAQLAHSNHIPYHSSHTHQLPSRLAEADLLDEPLAF